MRVIRPLILKNICSTRKFIPSLLLISMAGVFTSAFAAGSIEHEMNLLYRERARHLFLLLEEMALADEESGEGSPPASVWQVDLEVEALALRQEIPWDQVSLSEIVLRRKVAANPRPRLWVPALSTSVISQVLYLYRSFEVPARSRLASDAEAHRSLWAEVLRVVHHGFLLNDLSVHMQTLQLLLKIPQPNLIEAEDLYIDLAELARHPNPYARAAYRYIRKLHGEADDRRYESRMERTRVSLFLRKLVRACTRF